MLTFLITSLISVTVAALFANYVKMFFLNNFAIYSADVDISLLLRFLNFSYVYNFLHFFLQNFLFSF